MASASFLFILMHLRMWHNVWLDYVRNLRQYILRYTFRNSTSWAKSLVIGQRSEYTSLTQLMFLRQMPGFDVLKLDG